jgi:3-oxoacyl-[acyl-carrier protein] reductase
MQRRVAVITGGAGGIGKGVALKLFENGANVVIADLDPEAIERVVSHGAEFGCKAVGYTLDVRDEKSVQGMADTCMRELGRLDYLVNCAGIFKSVPMLDMTLEQWEEAIGINLTGTFLCMQKCARIMAEAGYGSIVNLSSHAAVRGSANHTHYCASKEGIIGLTRAFMREISESGVRVNSIAPDIIKTRMTMEGAGSRKQAWIERIPMKRFGEIEECADLILYLLSESSSYITGQNICITGGTI